MTLHLIRSGDDPLAGFVVIADDTFVGPSAIHPILQSMWPCFALGRQLPYNHLYKDVTLSVLEMKELSRLHNGMLDHNICGVKDPGRVTCREYSADRGSKRIAGTPL